jgi:DnaJ-domain-containing protein 1
MGDSMGTGMGPVPVIHPCPMLSPIPVTHPATHPCHPSLSPIPSLPLGTLDEGSNAHLNQFLENTSRSCFTFWWASSQSRETTRGDMPSHPQILGIQRQIRAANKRGDREEVVRLTAQKKAKRLELGIAQWGGKRKRKARDAPDSTPHASRHAHEPSSPKPTPEPPYTSPASAPPSPPPSSSSSASSSSASSSSSSSSSSAASSSCSEEAKLHRLFLDILERGQRESRERWERLRWGQWSMEDEVRSVRRMARRVQMVKDLLRRAAAARERKWRSNGEASSSSSASSRCTSKTSLKPAAEVDWTDHYSILGVDPAASTQNIKSAYRKRAKVWHPDKNHNSLESTEQFKKLNAASECLQDPIKRRRYDRLSDVLRFQ